jgi:SAM-dependent methyltransferase
MYSAADYSAMLSDEVRVRAYLAAIAATVRPGDVVLELGTGPGFFAVAACRAGAAHVFAVEPNDIIGSGPAVARANGCEAQITFLRGLSARVELPKRADVLIEDMRGVLPLHESRGAALVDAEARLLVRGARRVPRADTILAAPCRVPAMFREDLSHGGAARAGIDLAPLARLARNSWHKARFEAADLLGEPREVARLDFSAPGDLEVNGNATWSLRDATEVAGWCVWFDSDLAEGVSMSNAPGLPSMVYGQAFFPLAEAVSVGAGDRIEFAFRAAHALGEPVWAWDTTVARADGRRDSQRQSTLAGTGASHDALRWTMPEARPTGSGAHAVYATLIRLADGSRTNEEIARALNEAHAGAFRSTDEALQFTISRLQAIRNDAALL